ncbi:MAG TPA: DUF6632 domain-containing protein [Candidatus Sulfotelmatobacter sp.]
MIRDRVLKIVLVLSGVLFVAGMIPLIMLFSREPAVAMIMSLYVPMGVFVLLAVRDPSANRSLIAFAGWANIAHATVMAVQEYLHAIQPREFAGIILFGIFGIALVVLTPAKKTAERLAAAA